MPHVHMGEHSVVISEDGNLDAAIEYLRQRHQEGKLEKGIHGHDFLNRDNQCPYCNLEYIQYADSPLLCSRIDPCQCTFTDDLSLGKATICKYCRKLKGVQWQIPSTQK